jgi:hypothetical protein
MKSSNHLELLTYSASKTFDSDFFALDPTLCAALNKRHMPGVPEAAEALSERGSPRRI